MGRETKIIRTAKMLRARRVQYLGTGLRETANLLGISPAHLTDIEKGRRVPSDDLLIKISRRYEIDEPELRSGWERADRIVGEVATQDSITANKVPQFLRTARKLKPEQWDALIKQAKKLSEE